MARKTTIRNEDDPSPGDYGVSPINDSDVINLDDFAAVEVLLKLIRYKIRRCTASQTLFPHTLFTGSRGIGKQTMARMHHRPRAW